VWTSAHASCTPPHITRAPGGHIPYRDSKLTRILQPSLGGNAKTAIICNVTPAACHVEESHSTLRFACRAKRVVNNAVVNEVLSDAAVLKRQAHEIQELRRALAASGGCVAVASMRAAARRMHAACPPGTTRCLCSHTCAPRRPLSRHLLQLASCRLAHTAHLLAGMRTWRRRSATCARSCCARSRTTSSCA
jgi:hypothetical protein